MVIDTSKLNATSWKTTLVGLAGAIVIAVYPLIQGGKPTREQIILAVLTAAGGFFAKDSGVTGGKTLAAGAVPDAQLHAAAANEAVAPKA
jgi:hypothetical protein